MKTDYRALLIGINQYQNVTSLSGCINDVKVVKDYLVNQAGLSDQEILCLYDSEADAKGIRSAFGLLAKNAKPGERIYIHYSGHGTQMPTNNATEPDSMDEVLCPTDFDWTLETAIRDDDLLLLLQQIPTTTDVVISLDCCHAGDYSRNLAQNVRTPTLPSQILKMSRAGIYRRQSIRALGLQNNCLIISACSPFQEAIETVTKNGNMGVFTHLFIEQIAAAPRSTVTDVIKAIKPNLSSLGRTGMTPVLEGSNRLRTDVYARPSRSLTPRNIMRGIRSGTVLWNNQWPYSITSVNGNLSASIYLVDGAFELQVIPEIFGTITTLNIPLGGNINETFDLAFGFSLQLEVSSFYFDTSRLSFNLKIDFKSPFPFIPPVTIVDTPISISLTNIQRGEGFPLTSVADLIALQALQSPQRALIPNPRNTIRPFPNRQINVTGKAQGTVEILREAGSNSTAEANLLVIVGPCDDEGYLYINGMEVLSTRFGEIKQWRGKLNDGFHSIRTRLRNSGAWGWRSTIRIYVNGVLVSNQDKSGGSFLYNGFIDEVEMNAELDIQNGQLQNLSGG